MRRQIMAFPAVAVTVSSVCDGARIATAKSTAKTTTTKTV